MWQDLQKMPGIMANAKPIQTIFFRYIPVTKLILQVKFKNNHNKMEQLLLALQRGWKGILAVRSRGTLQSLAVHWQKCSSSVGPWDRWGWGAGVGVASQGKCNNSAPAYSSGGGFPRWKWKGQTVHTEGKSVICLEYGWTECARGGEREGTWNLEGVGLLFLDVVVFISLNGCIIYFLKWMYLPLFSYMFIFLWSVLMARPAQSLQTKERCHNIQFRILGEHCNFLPWCLQSPKSPT